MKLFKNAILATSVLMALTASKVSMASEWSANIGLLSEYHFRGLIQNSTATANGGVDYSNDGFYLGAWFGDVEDGIEIDVYGGYEHELDSGFVVGGGLTTYQYTGDFDTAYNEINLSASYEYFSLEYTLGERDGDGAPDDSYTFTGLTLENLGFSLTVGVYGGDYQGEYAELGYSTTFEGFDLGVALIASGNDLDNDESMYFTISRTFQL